MSRIFYVGRTILSQYSEILSLWFGERKEYHITLAYSNSWFPYRADLRPTIVLCPPFEITSFGARRVLLVHSSELIERHTKLKEAGASWDFPSFNAHISIGDKEPDEMLTFPIVSGQEYYGTWEQQ